MEDQHGAVAIGAVPRSGRRGEPRRHTARVPGVPGQGPDPAERSCTCRGLVMDLSSTCRIPASVTRRITRLRGPLVAAVCQAPGRLTQIWLRNQGRSIGVIPRCRPDQDHCHKEPGNRSRRSFIRPDYTDQSPSSTRDGSASHGSHVPGVDLRCTSRGPRNAGCMTALRTKEVAFGAQGGDAPLLLDLGGQPVVRHYDCLETSGDVS